MQEEEEATCDGRHFIHTRQSTSDRIHVKRDVSIGTTRASAADIILPFNDPVIINESVPPGCQTVNCQ